MTDPAPTPWELHALRASAHFFEEAVVLTPLRHGENLVYAVGTALGRFVLRLHTAGRGEAALTSELLWLDHLAGAGLPVPQPRRARDGRWLAFLAVPGRPEGVWCSLLTWLDGPALPEGQEFSEPQAVGAGTLVARLHREAERFSPPASFRRPEYDAAHFQHAWERLDTAVSAHWSPARRAALGRRLLGRLEELGTFRELPGGFGLLHGDLHPGNFVDAPGGLGVLDFDRCGWGPFLLDMAHVTLALDRPERSAFLNAYTALRPLPPGLDHVLGSLRLLAAVENLAYLAPRPEERLDVLNSLSQIEAVLGGR